MLERDYVFLTFSAMKLGHANDVTAEKAGYIFDGLIYKYADRYDTG
jgi:hypothetical protein